MIPDNAKNWFGYYEDNDTVAAGGFQYNLVIATQNVNSASVQRVTIERFAADMKVTSLADGHALRRFQDYVWYCHLNAGTDPLNSQFIDEQSFLFQDAVINEQKKIMLTDLIPVTNCLVTLKNPTFLRLSFNLTFNAAVPVGNVNVYTTWTYQGRFW